MERSVQAVNGSLTVTIPSDYVRDAALRKGSRVTFTRHGNGLLMNPKANQRASLTTIGYQGREASDFMAALVDEGVKVLVDVRELPMSRKRGFGKNQLRTAIEDHGLDYVHMKSLGAPKDVRDPYKAGGSFVEFRKAYLSHLSHCGEALDELEALARDEATAIMCFEKNHAECHRQFVADALGERGLRIVHA